MRKRQLGRVGPRLRVDAETHGTFEEITRAVTQQTHVLCSTQAYLEPIRNFMQKTIGGLPVLAQKPPIACRKQKRNVAIKLDVANVEDKEILGK